MQILPYTTIDEALGQAGGSRTGNGAGVSFESILNIRRAASSGDEGQAGSDEKALGFVRSLLGARSSEEVEEGSFAGANLYADSESESEEKGDAELGDAVNMEDDGKGGGDAEWSFIKNIKNMAADRTTMSEKLLSANDMDVDEEEFSEVKSLLERLGASSEDIEGLEASLEAGELKWSELTGFINQTIAAARSEIGSRLNDDQLKHLESLFTKLGFSSEQQEGLFGALENGRVGLVFQRIQSQLSQAGGTEFSITMQELQALATAAGYDKDSATKFGSSNVGWLDDVSATKLSDLVGELEDKWNEDTKGLKVVLNELRSAVGDIVGRKLADADAGSEDRTLESRTPYQKVIDAEKDEKAAAQFTGKDADSKNKDGSSSGDTAQKESASVKSDADSQDQNQTRKADIADDLLSRLRVENEARDGGEQARAGQKAADATQREANTEQASRARDPLMDRNFFKQVEDGVLKNLGNGRRQISLDLKPEHLGSMHILLEMQGKDVRATIRTETHEASTMLGEQLAQLRESLEQQGFRVSKLEVQTGLPEDALSRNWQGADQHNKRQAMEEQVARRERLRNLRASMSAQEAGASDAAMNMHRPASDRVVDLIA